MIEECIFLNYFSPGNAQDFLLVRSMKISKVFLKQFNRPDTLIVLSSFPKRGGELAIENAIARYSYLLLTHFSKNQRIIVVCEKRTKKDRPYKLSGNILVVPTYTVDSLLFMFQINKTFSLFPQATNLLVQFEFSIYGGKRSIPSILGILMLQKLIGKHIAVMFHQVVDNIDTLSGHLGLKKRSITSQIYNVLLRQFYKVAGWLSNVVLVHDSLLKTRLAKFVNKEKVFVVPHGNGNTRSFSNKFRKESRASLGFNNQDKIIAVFGYRSWYKGTDWIIRAVGKLSRKYPNQHIKLLLAGGESPTLKGTGAYKIFSKELAALLEKYQDLVVATGFVQDSDVSKIFAAADVVVFPYRTRMSASGALSLAWRYGKPFLASKAFAENFSEPDISAVMNSYEFTKDRIAFKLFSKSFEHKLLGLLDDSRLQNNLLRIGNQIVRQRNWRYVGKRYLEVCVPVLPALKGLDQREFSYAT